MKKVFFALFALLLLFSQQISAQTNNKTLPFTWDNATVYFMLTDRFNNGDPSNDGAYGRQKNTQNHEMDFYGGDLKGVTAKIEEGYFDKLGVNAIWVTAFYEQMHNGIGQFNYYSYHGYFTKDWSQVDAAMGNEADLRTMVDAAHSHGIRIVLDVVMNHSGYPADGADAWPDSWVRSSYPGGNEDIYKPLEGLPDMRTEDPKTVDLPQWLINKWQTAGIKDKEVNELNAFFTKTGKSRCVKNYLIKWLSDWVREFGIDGFRCDTAKHITVDGWKDLKDECNVALKEWKTKNPTKKLDDLNFWMTGEVFGQSVWDGKNYYFDNGFDNVINFAFNGDCNKQYEDLFSGYSSKINSTSGFNTLSYIASHDVKPSDSRNNLFTAGTKMLLCPGSIQIYYGDESKRPFFNPTTYGDQGYRSYMNWDAISTDANVKSNLAHWQKLGVFRKEHTAVGAGLHIKKSDSPYTFVRSGGKAINNDAVVAVLDISGTHSSVTLSAYGLWPDGTVVKDYYSNTTATVSGGNLTFQTTAAFVLAGKPAVPAESVVLTFTPAPGRYNPSVAVTMSATTTAANGSPITIYYTVDGTNPSVASTKYSSSINVSSSTTIKAIAVDSKGNISPIIIGDYLIGIEPPTLTITPDGGNFENGTSVSVTLKATDANDSSPKIFYTVDGTNPTTASTLYSGGLTISETDKTVTLKAIATNVSGGQTVIKTSLYKFAALPKGLTIYFKKPTTWSGASIHYWACEPTTVTATAWPGVAMTDNGDGYYKYVIVGATKASIVFTDGQPNTSTKTTDQVGITRNPAYFDNGVWSDGPYVVPSDLIIHVKVTGQTTAPYLYDYTPEHNGAWPGTQISGSADANGYFTYKFPAGVTSANIIFNLGQGKNQTGNIVAVSKESYFVWDGNNNTNPITALSKQDFAKECTAPYPNPFENALKLKVGNENGQVKISISNALGGEVYSQNIETLDGQIELNLEIPNGIYVLRATTKEGSIAYKIIKK